MKLLRHLGIVAAIVFSVLSAKSALAHPHVWVTIETEIELSENKEIIGFRHKWTFDEYYTAFAVEGLDANGDGTYSEEELKPLAQTNIEALKDFEYFTYPVVKEEKLALKDPVNYRLEYKEKLLALYFELPLAMPVPYEKMKDFSLAVYDPAMYIALTFDDKAPAKIVSANSIDCTAHVGDRAHGTKAASAPDLGETLSGFIGLRYAERITITCPS
jgi:ABC-type uncharacterized transport system substrate-binding protein